MNSAEVITAVVARLSAVTAVTSLLGTVPGGYQASAVYTKVPQPESPEDEALFPYITVGLANARPLDTKTSNGGDVLVDVHIWYRGASIVAGLAVADAVYDALQKYDALAVTGANVIDCRFDGGADFLDPDGETHHAVRTFRVSYFLT